MSKKLKILVVDDEEIVLSVFERLLGKSYKVRTAKDSQTALREVKNEGHFNIVFLDIVLPGMSGTEIVREIRQISPESRIVMMTGYPIEEKINDSLKMGAMDCLLKPFTVADIVATVAQIKEIIEISKS